MIAYRRMTESDIATGLALCRSAGWNQLERDWKIFLALSPNGCRVATQGNRIVGTATTVRYQNSFSWIGMVLVDATCQRQGIGMQLLKEALQILKDEDTIKLDATPAGRKVYLKLDFIDEYSLVRMSTMGFTEQLKVSQARSMDKSDLGAVEEFDHKIFGAYRHELLEWMLEGAQHLAYVVKEKNEILGYCLGRNGYKYTQIGPIVAKEPAVAKDLLAAALNNCMGHPVIVDALYLQPEWIEWLTSIGFTQQRPLIRMYRGSNRFSGVPEKQFAILGPEFG